MSIIIGIDASRCRSGGAINHIVGILKHLPDNIIIKEIHVWSYQKLLLQLPQKHNLIFHEHLFLEKNLFFNLFWQFFLLKRSLTNAKCDILFTADASTVCSFVPQVVLSQDLLSYEKGILKKYSFSFSKIRIIIIRYLQNIAFKRSVGTIFLNSYSKSLIENYCGILTDSIIIPHGVNPVFFNLQRIPNASNNTFKLIYISNAEIYKNHLNVLKGFKILIDRGMKVHLTFVGGGDTSMLNDFNQFIIDNNIPLESFNQYDFLKIDQILNLLSSSDIFIFASTCESFGITLLEGMASGLPIACSNKSSLPELLLDGGVYFDPEDYNSIANAIELLLNDRSLRENLSFRAKEIAKNYTWERTAFETFNYILKKSILL